MRKQRTFLNAYLTVYLALIFPVLLTLVFTLLQGARISAMHMRTECVTDIAMNAVLSEYNRELFKQYDLLFVDMSYGNNHASIANTEAHLRNYLKENLENGSGPAPWRDFLGASLLGTEITQCSIASDNNGNVMRRQIGDYYELSLAGKVEDLLPDSGLDLTKADDLSEKARQMREENTDLLSRTQSATETGKSDNPADIANASRSGGVLGIVLNNTGSISRRRINTNDYISHRNCFTGNGIPPEAAAISTGCSEPLFHKYIFEKMGCYLEEMDKGRLQYQIEYLVAGKSCDWDNLEAVSDRLLAIREGVNTAYIFTDGGKVAEAESWAAGMASVILMPELLEPIKISLLLAWAYVESLQDVKILLEGYKVPPGKTAADWHTQLSDILNIKGALRSIPSQSGMSYSEYLNTILYAVGKQKKTFRAMDIMEMDVRQTVGNSAFRMDACLDSLQAKIHVGSRFGADTDIIRRYGYYFVH